jgi:amidohydrolase
MRRFAMITLVSTLFVPTAAAWLRAEDLTARVGRLVQAVAPQVIQWRRDIHAHPELGNREQRTGQVIAERLHAMGVVEIRTGVAHHGVVALIHGGRPGPVVALRSDMDALPIHEQTGLPFASQNDGVMHACGHDAHMAILLGAAQVLVELRDVLPGTVKLIFQPAEEGVPRGEEGGAKLMIKEGVLHHPDVAAIFGLHVNPEVEAGKLSYCTGPLLAAVDIFQVTITGKQSHAGMPWQGVDPIVATAHIVTALQTIRSRHTDTRQPVVVSIGMLHAGTACNVIPEKVVFDGTVRTHNPQVRRQVAEWFRRIVEGTAAAHGVTAQIRYDDYGPAVWNDPELGKPMRSTLVKAAGLGNVLEAEPIMGGEDFAHYAQQVPGFFFFLGVRNPVVGAIYPLHTPRMTIDEAALPLGVRAMSLLAIDYLTQHPPGKAASAVGEGPH